MVNLNQRRVISVGSGDCLAEGQPCGGGRGTCMRNIYDNQLFCSMNLPFSPQKPSILPSPYSAQVPSYLTPMDVWTKSQIAQKMNMPKFFDTDGKSQMIMFRGNTIPVVSSEAACVHCILTHPANPQYCRNICRIWD